MITYRPQFVAAAAICCRRISTEDGTASIDTPLWSFHGDSDKTVPAARRATAWLRGGRQARTLSIPSMPEWTTTSGSGFSPNRSCQSGYWLNAVRPKRKIPRW